MNKAKNTTTDVDLGVIPGNFGKISGSASTENYNIFGNHSFDGYGTIAQLKNIWSNDSSDNQVSVPDLVLQSFPGNGIFSRKVFVGGLPPDVTANSLSLFFEQFGANTVDWPHRKCTGSDIPPNGYAFVVFMSDRSVEYLVSRCICKQGKLNILLKNGKKEVKVVQVRPWALSDQVYRVTDAKPLSDRFSVFIGGVPRTTTASELAMLLQQTIGDVVYVSLEVDAETKYPKGAAQVVFNNRESYLTAIAMRLITLTTIDQVKEIEIKPYLMDFAQCEMCNLADARYLCPELCCLMYMCEPCWTEVHKQRGLLHHRPMTKAKPGSPMRNISNYVTAFPFFNPSLDHHNHSGLRSTNQQQQLCHCRVRETLPLQRLLQQYIMQANRPPCHHSSFI
ncbi:cytoplasmic polyadenylation element binding protein CPEB2, putative [Brugia malayi]|uniref:Cytoplasmic polyadenylation element binding protein CPEB2, putative n=1 Tax=Brugia malayi TaxID=6279 RepID=A0A4E9EZW5_BRUMA|nr:cytoplasmic polyadenylation element binding protein CPEB2, putative [Brugia malayi]VIO89865.1 cytoplasmic polyadenylation element binding protein CPEB2, putative [Brugia malayi]